jgi:GWxTD domain-containing protein
MQPCLSTACRALMVLGLLYPASIVAQDGDSTRTDTVPMSMNGNRTLTRTSPCFEGRGSKQEKQRENKAIANLPEFARFWLTEDVVYLISPEERCAFLHLASDRERDQFIEQFWSRRAPDPTSLENSFKHAHYERIALADEKYGTEVPGWKTDRGRIYVTFGPPDSLESHRAGEKTGRPRAEGEEWYETYQYSWEGWYYRHLDGVGENLELEFVDPSESGDYRLATPTEMKDKLIFLVVEESLRNRLSHSSSI